MQQTGQQPLLTCSWTLTDEESIGTSLNQALNDLIAIKASTEKTLTLDLINMDKFQVLSKADSEEPCEIRAEFPPNTVVRLISLVCDAKTIETFLGAAGEYYRTSHGAPVEEFAELEDLKPHRHDIELPKTSRFEIRFLTSGRTELFLFGMEVQVQEAITAPQQAINFQNVQRMLDESSHPLSEGAQKAREFLTRQSLPLVRPQMPSLDAVMAAIQNGRPESDLKDYLDHRLGEMEARMNQKLAEMEARQNLKLEQILQSIKRTQD